MATAVVASLHETAGDRRRPLRIATGEASDWSETNADDIVVLCPWLDGLDLVDGLWLSVLPIHDCNAFVDGDWTFSAPPGLRVACYVGIFALDRLRSARQILAPLREKGVERLINLPSISFFDGAATRTFGRLDFTGAGERGFLVKAMAEGFAAALCARREEPLEPDEVQRYDFVLRHAGPGEPMLVEPRPDRCFDLAALPPGF